MQYTHTYRHAIALPSMPCQPSTPFAGSGGSSSFSKITGTRKLLGRVDFGELPLSVSVTESIARATCNSICDHTEERNVEMSKFVSNFEFKLEVNYCACVSLATKYLERARRATVTVWKSGTTNKYVVS